MARGVAGSRGRGGCERLAGQGGRCSCCRWSTRVLEARVVGFPREGPVASVRPGPEHAPGGLGPLVRVPEPEPGVPELVAFSAPRGSDDVVPHRLWVLHGARAILGALSPCALAPQCLFKGSPGLPTQLAQLWTGPLNQVAGSLPRGSALLQAVQS